MSTKLLNRRQVRWSEFLSRFNFQIVYRPGKANGKPDALTRRSGDLPREGYERLLHQSQTMIKTHNLRIDSTTLDQTDVEKTLDELFNEGYDNDPIPRQALDNLHNGKPRHKTLSMAECEDNEGKLRYRKKLYVPEYTRLRLKIMDNHHSSPAAGHPGRSRTLELLSRELYWPKMHQDIDRFIRNCHIFQRSKTSWHAPFGITQPLLIPHRTWEDISMDYVVGLPWSDGFNAVLVVVCQLTKMRHLIHCRDTCKSEKLADLYLKSIARLLQPSSPVPLPYNPCHSHPCHVTHLIASFPY